MGSRIGATRKSKMGLEHSWEDGEEERWQETQDTTAARVADSLQHWKGEVEAKNTRIPAPEIAGITPKDN